MKESDYPELQGVPDLNFIRGIHSDHPDDGDNADFSDDNEDRYDVESG